MNDITDVIDLRAGRARLGVVPGIGGSIAYYRWIDGTKEHDWLRPTPPEDLLHGTADRLACFPLVPFSNRVRDGRFAFGGRDICLPLNQLPQPHAEHGHGWQARWIVAERADDRLALEYDHPADAWPFPYRARQEFALSDDELHVTLSVENRGRETMPVGLGLHPYFPRTAQCRLWAHVDAMWATDDEVMPTALTVADPRLASGDGMRVSTTPLDNVFTGWRREAAIAWPERHARLRIDAGAPLDFLVVYAPPDEDYFCVEPVSHCTDAFNLAGRGRRDTGMLTLKSGATLPVSTLFRPSLM
ncbi:MAG: aldose 1-epimerase [Betaproteobacteria bacterium]